MTTTSTFGSSKNTSAIGAVFGMIATTANTITGTLTAIGESSDMLNAYVTQAKLDQAVLHEIHRETFESKAVIMASVEHSKLTLEVRQHLTANPEIVDDFNDIQARLLARLAAKK